MNKPCIRHTYFINYNEQEEYFVNEYKSHTKITQNFNIGSLKITRQENSLVKAILISLNLLQKEEIDLFWSYSGKRLHLVLVLTFFNEQIFFFLFLLT